MGTFPAATDYARPAPVPAEGIPSIAAPQYTTTSAETTIAAGRDAQQTAQDIDKFGLHIDTLLAQDAVNKLRADKADLTYGQQNGFMNVKGAAVLEPGPGGQKVFESYPARLQAAADAIGGKLGGRAAMMFKAKADEEMGSYKTELLRHTMQQVDVAHKQSYAAGSAQDITDAVRSSFDQPALMKLEERARVRAQVEEQRGGLVEGSLSKPAVSNIFRAAMEDLVAKNDLTGALQMYGTFASKLDGPDALAVQRQVKTVEKLLEVQRDITAAWGGTIGGAVGPGAATGGGSSPVSAVHADATAALAAKGIKVEITSADRSIAHNDAIGGAPGSFHTHTDKALDLKLPADRAQQEAMLDQYLADPRVTGIGFYPGSHIHVDTGGRGTKTVFGFKADPTGQNWPQWAKDKIAAWKAAPASANPVVQAKADGAPTQSGGTVSRETLGPGAVAAPPAASSDPLFGPDGAPAPAAAPPGDPLAAAGNAVPGGSSPPRQEPGAPPPQEPGGGVLGIARAKIALNDQYIKARDAAMLARRLDPNLPAILSGLKVKYEEQKLTLETEQLKVTNEMQMYVLQGGPNGSPATVPPNAALWSQFTPEQQGHYLKLFEHNAKGADPPWTPKAASIFAKLSDMAAGDPDEFRKFDLLSVQPHLPKAQWLQLYTMRDQILKGGQKEYDTAKALKMLDRSLTEAGVDIRDPGSVQGKAKLPNEKDVMLSADMKRKLIDWVERFQIENKRAPKDMEMRQHIDDMVIVGRISRPETGLRAPSPWLAAAGVLGPSIYGAQEIWRKVTGAEEQQAGGPPGVKVGSGRQGMEPGTVLRATVPQADLDKFYVPYKSIPAEHRTVAETRVPQSLQGAERTQAVEREYMRFLAARAATRRSQR